MTTMIDPLRRAATVASAAQAVKCGEFTLTYAETWDRCQRLAGALTAMGMRRGDRVAVMGANCHRYLELYQAAPGAGFAIVPLNHRHTDAELRYALDDSGARVLFCDRDAGPFGSGVEHVIRLDSEYEELLTHAPRSPFPDDVREDDIAGLFYTGGTTGKPKGVMLTHGNLIANALHFQAEAPFTPRTRWLVAAPLYHAAGSVAVLPTVWHAGLQVILPAFEAAAALDLVEQHRVTDALFVPTMLAAINEEQARRPRDVSSLRAIHHGGSPIATQTLRHAHANFPGANLIHSYGATETSPFATMLVGEEQVLDTPRARSCGQPIIGVDIRVLDTEGNDAARGAVGEVAIRGANVMAGYWKLPGETAQVLNEGWFRTGDVGYMDEDSYLFLVDRAKDMIVTGGENVYSTEVEEALYSHPAVLEAAVFGVPDERWGEAVHATVVLREPIEPAALIAHCHALIAAYKAPKQIDISEGPLPKSGAGKILKRELRAPFWGGRSVRISGA